MAYLNEIRFPREVKDARQVMDCLRQMDDQVRYTLQNLDGNNIRAGAIGESHLSGTLQQQIRTAERTGEDVSSLRQSLETVSAGSRGFPAPAAKPLPCTWAANSRTAIMWFGSSPPSIRAVAHRHAKSHIFHREVEKT